MSDGMMEAARAAERGESEDLIYLELLRCLEDAKRPHNLLLVRAKETDEIRGGMVGRTTWVTRVKSLLGKLRAKDETAWMRVLEECRGRGIMDGARYVTLYTSFKALSPFRDDIVCLSMPPDDLGHLAHKALQEHGYSTSDDRFAYVFRMSDNRPVVRPIWLWPTSLKIGKPPRAGPLVRKE